MSGYLSRRAFLKQGSCMLGTAAGAFPVSVHATEAAHINPRATVYFSKEISPEASIHDFRITNGGERVNMIFDLLLPFELEKQAEEIEKKIKERIHQENEKYYAVIKVEYPYY